MMLKREREIVGRTRILIIATIQDNFSYNLYSGFFIKGWWVKHSGFFINRCLPHLTIVSFINMAYGSTGESYTPYAVRHVNTASFSRYFGVRVEFAEEMGALLVSTNWKCAQSLVSLSSIISLLNLSSILSFHAVPFSDQCAQSLVSSTKWHHLVTKIVICLPSFSPFLQSCSFGCESARAGKSTLSFFVTTLTIRFVINHFLVGLSSIIPSTQVKRRVAAPQASKKYPLVQLAWLRRMTAFNISPSRPSLTISPLWYVSSCVLLMSPVLLQIISTWNSSSSPFWLFDFFWLNWPQNMLRNVHV